MHEGDSEEGYGEVWLEAANSPFGKGYGLFYRFLVRLTKRSTFCYNLTNTEEKDEDDGSSLDKV